MKILASIALASMLLAASDMTPLQSDVAERLLVDEEIWGSDGERLTAEDQAFFMKRVEQAARDIGLHAEGLTGVERERYITGVIEGPEGVRETLKAEMVVRARGGELPPGDLVPRESRPWWRVGTVEPRWIVVGVLGSLVLAQLGIILTGRIRKKKVR